MSAIIAGGGMVGLTSAIVLRAAAIDAVVPEQAPEIRGACAALVCCANTLAVFDELGLGEQLAAIGRPAEMYFRDPAGRLIDPPGFSADDHRYLLVNRPKVNALLADAVGHDNIRLNSRLAGYD